MSFLNNLKTKILLSVLFPGVVVLAFVAVIALFGYEQVAQDVVLQRDTELARVSASHLAEALRRHTSTLQAVAASEDVNSLSPVRITRLLNDDRDMLFVFDAGVVAYDRDGRAVAADTYADRLVGESYPFEASFNRLRDGEEVSFTDVFSSPISRDDVVMTTVPILGSSGEFLGILTGMSNIYTSTISETFSEVLEFKSGGSNFAYVVDGRGRIVYHRDGTYLSADFAELPPVARALNGETGAIIADDPDGNRVLSGFAPVPGTTWSVVTQESWDVIAAPIRSNNILLLSLLAGGGVVAASVVFFAMSTVLRPIKDLSAGAQRIASGDFDYRIRAETDDELEDLANQFNVMAATLKASYSELEQRVADRTRELRESEERLRGVITGAPVILAMMDRDGIFTFMEGTALERAGIDASRAIGRSAFEVMGPYQEDIRKALSGEEFVSTFEMSGVMFEARYTPMLDEDGEVTGVIGVATDITERQQAQDALRKSEEQARELARENAVMAEIGRTISMSPEIEDVYERFAEQVQDFLLFDTISVSYVDLQADSFTVAYNWGIGAGRPIGQALSLRGSATGEIVRTGKGVLLDLRNFEELENRLPLLRPAYDTGHRSFVGVPLISKGEVIGVLHVMTVQPGAYSEHELELLERVAGQISGAVANAQLYHQRLLDEEALRRYAEDLSRSNADLEQFAYVASHDLQEPLRAIVGFTRMLARRYEGKLGDEADDYISRTVNASMRMQSLITDLLAYSRIGTNLGEPEVVNTERMLDKVLDSLRATIEEKDAVVTRDTMPVVTTHPSVFDQVLSNLVINAVKYNDSKPPNVHISAEQQEKDWLFSVKDNGIGIDPQFQDRIFVIFQRLHGRTEYSGTGIGLAICKKAVERLGGKLWVESEPGNGATFYFTIPLGENDKFVESSASSNESDRV